MAYVAANVYRFAFSRTDPIGIPVPWTRPVAVIEPPRRQPSAYPPEPDQCYVCGMHDPQRVEAFGTATHPECEEWLGDWKPPAPSVPPNRHPIILPSSGTTMAQVAANIEAAFRPLAIPGYQYTFTCKCPVCENHWFKLRSAANGHPQDCRCTYCEAVRDARTHTGDHHRNCMCAGGLYCARIGPQPKPFVVDGHLTYPGDYTEQEIRDAYDDLNARYTGRGYPGHEDRVGCTCDVCKLAADYAAYKADVDSLPPMIIPGGVRQAPAPGARKSLDGHFMYATLPPPHVLGFTEYPAHGDLRNGICQACKLIADYHAQPKRVIGLPPFVPDPRLTKRVRE